MKKILCMTLVLAMGLLAFAGCGSKDEEKPAESTANNQPAASEEVDSVEYVRADDSVEDDKFVSTILIEYQGDEIIKVTDTLVDDFSATSNGIAKLHMDDFDCELEDSGLLEAKGVTCDVTKEDKVRTEVAVYDVPNMSMDDLKKFRILWDTGKDYFSLEEYVKYLENEGYSKK